MDGGGGRVLRAVGYVRQSRESVAAASPEAQRRAVEDYVRSQGWRLVEVFTDIGRSGFDPKVQRPGLDALLTTVEKGGVERVVVWKLDRLTRRGIGEALTIVDRIRDAGAALVSVTEPFDTSSALGEGIFALLLSLAKAESEKLAERVKSGKAVVRKRGGWLGGPVPYGFRVERVDRPGHQASRLVLDPDRAPVVRRMVDHVLAGGTVRSLQQQLNRERISAGRGREWNQTSIFALLRSPVLAGQLPDGHGDVLRDPDGRAHIYGEPLISVDEWRELQARVTPRKGRRPSEPSLLGGIARCAGCDSPMAGDGSRNQYRCSRNARGLDCPAPARVPMRATDAYVLGVLTAVLQNALELRALTGTATTGAATAVTDSDPYERTLRRFARWWALRQSSTDLESLVNERADLDAARARLREMYAAGDFTDDPAQYRKLHDRYQHRHDELNKLLADLEELPTPAIVTEPDFIAELDFDTQRDLITELAGTHIRCHKAARPGIRFNPHARIQWEEPENDEVEPARS
jgi:DNA invertase Pin-like site-specific DNA recombinase